MSDISANERRLRAAFDRIDQILDAGALAPAPAGPDDAEFEALKAENARLSETLEQMQAERAADLAQMEQIMTELERLLASDTPPDEPRALPEGTADGAGVPEEDQPATALPGKEEH